MIFPQNYCLHILTSKDGDAVGDELVGVVVRFTAYHDVGREVL